MHCIYICIAIDRIPDVRYILVELQWWNLPTQNIHRQKKNKKWTIRNASFNRVSVVHFVCLEWLLLLLAHSLLCRYRNLHTACQLAMVAASYIHTDYASEDKTLRDRVNKNRSGYKTIARWKSGRKKRFIEIGTIFICCSLSLRFFKYTPNLFRFVSGLHFAFIFFLKRNSCVRDQNLRKWNSIFCLVILCVCLNCVKWKTSKLAWRGTKRYCSSLMLFWAILLREWMNNERDIGTSSYFTLYFFYQTDSRAALQKLPNCVSEGFCRQQSIAMYNADAIE